MFEVQVIIPVKDNDGEAFTAEHFAAFEVAIVDSFGGFSLLPGELVGGWRNDAGVEYRDRSRVYAVAVSGIAAGDKVAALARFAKALFAQEAIAIRYLGQFEIID
jgi:hypothetical protein